MLINLRHPPRIATAHVIAFLLPIFSFRHGGPILPSCARLSEPAAEDRDPGRSTHRKTCDSL